jgi:diketogulonate reductase-like aldo/keto reductase
VTEDKRARVLADGNEIPVLGLGVWQVPDGPETEDAVRWALELGYRHVDTAQAYGNEESVGRALRDSGVPRDEVFITTKFNPAREDPEAEAQQSLERLGVEQVDLYIIHWPEGGLFSPFEYRRKLLATSEEGNVTVEAYSPLGTGRHLSDRRVQEIAERVGRTPAQVLLRWCLQRDLVVITKSTHRERLEENGQIFDFNLSDKEMAALDALDETGGTERALERRWW